jgi:pimeloyl-ACP methyl ester carboxylesterase
VVTFDYRGHGCSENPRVYAFDTVGAAAFADDGWRVVAAAKVDAPTIIVAYSYGVQVGLEMMRQRADVVKCFVAVLGAPERILDGLLPKVCANALVETCALGRFGIECASWILGFLLRVGASFSVVCYAIARSTGYLRSGYYAFAKPFFTHLARLDAKTWALCVVDGHRNGAQDVFKSLNRKDHDTRDDANIRFGGTDGCYLAVIAGDCDFAASKTVTKSWERAADFFVLLKRCAHDGLRTHTEEIVGLTRDVYARAGV